MKYRAVISTNEIEFARMLELELSNMGVEVLSRGFVDNFSSDFFVECPCDILILDLDLYSGENKTAFPKNVFVVGWSNFPDVSKRNFAFDCSALFSRPFLISEFRKVVVNNVLSKDENNVLNNKINTLYYDNNIQKNKNKKTFDINPTESSVTFGEHKISLSEYELKVLQLLFENVGQAVSRQTISELIDAPNSNMGDVYICRLRKKLESKSSTKFIYTVRGKGYMLRAIHNA